MDIDKQKLLHELQNNPKVREYFTGFDENSVKQFLEDYVSKKEILLTYGEDWRKRQHGETGYFRMCAEQYYWIIAQKKLFNLQCHWRAGQIDLPIDTTWDFLYWEANIKNCSFIEDITAAEIETMIRYLEQAPYDDENDDALGWQEYDEFKDEKTGLGTNDNYPDWYYFYDAHFAISNVTLLPDLVGEMEKKYLAAWRDNTFGKTPDKIHEKPVKYCNSEITEDFIRKVEPYKILEYYRLEREYVERMEFLERLENVLQILKEEEEEEVYIPEGKFPDAIFQALHILKVSKIKLLLPIIHQSHMERKAMGISYQEEDQLFQSDLAQTMKERINEGKRLLGEE
jgi:hypothetical protein